MRAQALELLKELAQEYRRGREKVVWWPPRYKALEDAGAHLEAEGLVTIARDDDHVTLTLTGAGFEECVRRFF